MLNLSSQIVYCIVHIFIFETCHQEQCLKIQFNWLHIPTVNRKHAELPHCFSWPVQSVQDLLATPHSRAMTNVCQFNVMHRKGMESML